MGMPSIEIIFKQLAVSAIARSQRGVAGVIMVDDTVGADKITKKTYLRETDIDKTLYTAANLRIIKRMFLVAVNKVVIISIGSQVDFAEALKLIRKVKLNYICTTAADKQQELANAVLAYNSEFQGRKIKGVVYKATVADDKHIINCKNEDLIENVTDSDGNATTEAIKMRDYLPRITSVLANLPMNRSITYYVFEDLAEVDDLTDVESSITNDSLIDDGWFILVNDDEEVRAARGVNSLTSFTSTDSEDMSKIIIVESMDLMIEDIYNTFKEKYIGKYKNYYDNQMLFICAVNSYFKVLEDEEILDPNYTGNDDLGTTGNMAYIDVEAQRNAWLSVGKAAAADWSDEKVREMSFKSKVFLAGNVKILDAVEDLRFVITME